ncbi:MAG: DUF4179 domain-containing protein [Anaerovoracaceae bacterium]
MEDRRQEWAVLIEQCNKYPEGLVEVEARLEKRLSKRHKKRNAFYSSLSAVAAVLIFVVMVNTSAAFADGISQIPLLGKLAEYVKFDKGLSGAIENDYVQKVSLTAFDGQEQLMLPYVIADEKNLVLFFQLPEDFKQTSEEWVHISLEKMIDRATGKEVEGFSYLTSGLSMEGREQNHSFILQRYHFSESTLPASIVIDVNVEISIHNGSLETEDVAHTTEENFDRSRIERGAFRFQVDFDDFAGPIIYDIGKEYIVFDQQLTLERMKVYPTGTEVTFTFPDENTAWIKGLDLEIKKDGEILQNGVNGLVAINDDENRWIKAFIESDYFDKPKKKRLIIGGMRVLDKDEEFITIDLNNKTISPAVSDIELEEVKIREGKADLVFSTEVENNEGFGMFHFDYKDQEGNVHTLKEEGFTIGDNSEMKTGITVVYPPSGRVILQRSLAPMRVLEKPVKIDIPMQE